MTRMDRSESQPTVHSRDPSIAAALRRGQRFLGARKIVGRKRKRGVPPGDGSARQQERRGEESAYLVVIMQHRDDGSPFCLPAPQEKQEIPGRAFIQESER